MTYFEGEKQEKEKEKREKNDKRSLKERKKMYIVASWGQEYNVEPQSLEVKISSSSLRLHFSTPQRK
jgi:hypothetical protein